MKYSGHDGFINGEGFSMIPVNAVRSVAVIGNGLMGQGISQVFARAGKLFQHMAEDVTVVTAARRLPMP